MLQSHHQVTNYSFIKLINFFKKFFNFFKFKIVFYYYYYSYLHQFVDVDERVHGFAFVRGHGGRRVPLALAPRRREVHLSVSDARAQQEHGQQQQGTHVGRGWGFFFSLEGEKPCTVRVCPSSGHVMCTWTRSRPSVCEVCVECEKEFDVLRVSNDTITASDEVRTICENRCQYILRTGRDGSRIRICGPR